MSTEEVRARSEARKNSVHFTDSTVFFGSAFRFRFLSFNGSKYRNYVKSVIVARKKITTKITKSVMTTAHSMCDESENIVTATHAFDLS
jgi:hypothetical protein